MNRVSAEDPRPDTVRDLADAIAVRQEGGSAAPEVLARGFLDQLQDEINRQVDRRVEEQIARRKGGAGGAAPDKEMILGLALGSMGIAVPLSAIAGYFGHSAGLALVWVSIVIINIAWSQRR